MCVDLAEEPRDLVVAVFAEGVELFGDVEGNYGDSAEILHCYLARGPHVV